MEFRVLGPLEAEIGGREIELGGPKQRAILAALLLSPGQVVPVDRLIDDVWGERAPRTAQHSVQLYISELRKAFGGNGAGPIVTRPPGYILEVDPETVDAVRFKRFVDDARPLMTEDPAAALALLEEALELWRGPAFADVSYDDFVQPEIRRLEELRLEAEDARDEARLATSDPGAAVAGLRKRVEGHPLRERTRGLYMRALAAAGRQSDALRTFQDVRLRLAEQLGIEPGVELRRLEELILLQDPILHPSSEAPVAVRNPYKGLRPFTEAEAGDFFGRDELIDRLVCALRETRFVTIVGPSGSGKSSVVRAGLVPALRASPATGPMPIVMVPGAVPSAALTSALAEEGLVNGALHDVGLWHSALGELPEGAELVLIVDQFEELYTLAGNEERRRFLAVLHDLATTPGGPGRIVAVMRADYYDRPLLDPKFGELFTTRVEHVMPMTAAGLELAATAPAAAAGLTIEPALLAEIVADVAGQPGGLPSFQFALTELAERREGTTLTAEAYHALGGVRGAVVGRADETVRRLDPEQLAAARQLAFRLVTLREHATPTRRRLPAAELASLDVDAVAMRAVLERFGSHRLLTFDRDPATGRPTVELAHDALLEQWELLGTWIEEGRTDLRRHRALAAAVAEWVEAGSDPDYLPAGAQLETYEQWAAASAMRLTADEARYLTEARMRANTVAEAEQARDEAERRLQRRARTRLVALAALAIAVVAAAIAAFVLTRPAGPRIALVYWGRGSSYNDLYAQGWDRVGKDVAFRGDEVVPHTDPEGEVRALAAAGYDLIIGGGSMYVDAIDTVAREFPGISFAIIDASVDLPNVTSLDFASAEGGFLAGAAAALSSQSDVVGFVGGASWPLIESFRAGFEAGVRYVDPDIEVLAVSLSLGWDGFNRPDLGKVAGELLYDRGADVVFHAAGATGWGVVQAAQARSAASGRHLWVIGVDSDQYLDAEAAQRPFMLTSVVKRLDVAVEQVIGDFVAGQLASGHRRLGLAEDGIELATTGGYLDDVADALRGLEEQLAAQAIDVPVVPVGQVLMHLGAGDYDTTITVTYGSDACVASGPAPTSGQQVRLVLRNRSDAAAWMGFAPLKHHATTEELLAIPPAGPYPEYVLTDEGVGAFVSSGETVHVVTAPLDAGFLAMHCLLVDEPSGEFVELLPATVLTVR